MSRPNVLAFILVALLSTAVHGATIDFSFSNGSQELAAGSFSYDPSLEGGVLSYADLDAFSFTILGRTYDLAYINSGGFNQYVHFAFDTSTDTFLATTIGGFPQILSAIKHGFRSGFFVRPPDNVPRLSEYSAWQIGRSYTTLEIERAAEPQPIPEPASLAMGLVGLAALVARRRSAA